MYSLKRSFSTSFVHHKLLGIILLVLGTLATDNLHAQGNLMITPRRVLFEGPQKTQELNLANTGQDTARYVISLIEIRMKEDGTFEQITQPDPGQQFASSHIRFFPRSVVLGPGEVQTVKVQVTGQATITEGEYRSHIYFRAVPKEEPLGELPPAEDSSNISVKLVPVFGISIPVIIRSGASDATVQLSRPSLERAPDGKPLLNLLFQRKGNMSVYGDLSIDFVARDGKVTRVGEVKGIAVYTPTASRLVKIALGQPTGIDFNSGQLHIVYTNNAGREPVMMAQAGLSLSDIR